MRGMEIKKRHGSVKTMALFFWVLTLLVGLFACESEDGAGRKGLLTFELEVDTTALSTTTKTKAGSDEFAEFLKTADYAVEILQGSTSINSWERLDKMPESIELEPGTYQINVSKGSKEGAAFESPYFAGSSNFVIEEGMTTPLNVSASMANAKVTIEYSKDFLEAYTAYELTMKSSKMTLPIVYKQNETRAVYFQCDTSGTAVKIGMTLTNLYGKEINYNTSFTAKPKQWLRLNVKTDGEAINGLAVDIILNDEVIKTEHVTIGIPDFMDDLKGAPVLAITEGSTFHWLSETYPEPMVMNVGEFGTNASLNIFAGGKIGNCRLSITNEQETVFDYDLANLTEEQKTALNDRWSFKVGPETEDDFAADAKGSTSVSLNLLNILNELDGASSEVLYTGTLTITDMLPIANTTEAKFQVKLNVPAVPVIAFNEKFITEMNEGVIPADKVEAEQTVSIVAKGRIKSCILKIIDEDTNTSVSEENLTGNEGNVVLNKSKGNRVATLAFKNDWFKLLKAGEASIKNYRVVVEITDDVAQTETKEIKMKVKPQIYWVMAENNGDVFAKYAVLKIKAPNKDNVKFYQNDNCISEGVTLSEKDGVISFVWKGLSGSASYSNIIAKYKDYALDPIDIETEAEIYLGDKGKLEKWEAEGGEGHGDVSTGFWGIVTGYAHTPYRSWEKWVVENGAWGTLNSETTKFGGVNKDGPKVTSAAGDRTWTRYVANSGTIRTTGYDGGYGALIRTVGWGEGNTAGGGSANVIKEITPGELYLGTYDKGAPIYGTNFSSRPLGFSFKYKYESKNEDRFIAKIEIKNGDEIVAEGLFSSDEIGNKVNDWTDGKVILQYIGQNASLKATSMYILFKSGTSTAKDDIVSFAGFANLTNGENIGSQLYIDNVELIYDYE